MGPHSVNGTLQPCVQKNNLRELKGCTQETEPYLNSVQKTVSSLPVKGRAHVGCKTGNRGKKESSINKLIIH